ncbi:ribonuclease T2 family protein [mine drainage metagenome]|uniref:Ribonuclease T2 family protein n=1 Tax=mine drainage metagenome TaxID=410659 RepID=A0A1J5T112_9ZZZZ
MPHPRFLSALLLCLALCGALPARAEAPRAFDGTDRFPVLTGSLLALTWMPEFCGEHSANPTLAARCAHLTQGFALHGLWPQSADPRPPAYCHAATPVPAPLMQSLRPAGLGPWLIQHEWDRHGTCSGLAMGDYFSRLAAWSARLRIPAALRQPHAPLSVPAAEVKRWFAAENPGLSPAMMALACVGGKEEVRGLLLCLDADGIHPRPCAATLRGRCESDTVRFRPLDN